MMIIQWMDSMSEPIQVAQVNELLKSAYSTDFAASNESVQATQRRIQEGRCCLALLEDALVGCVILRTGSKPSAPLWYQGEGVASMGRLAVRPDFQRQGVASALLEFVEKHAKNLGCTELALDTSEDSKQLIRFYEKRGYRIVSTHQWPHTTFKSVVLSKAL
jgi:ribosomal protein S18 acetylase RimI-like enzyme